MKEPVPFSEDQLYKLCDQCKSFTTATWHKIPMLINNGVYYCRLERIADPNEHNHTCQDVKSTGLNSEHVWAQFGAHIDREVIYNVWRSLDESLSQQGLKLVFHHSLYKLQLSSQQGCHLCTTLWNAVAVWSTPDEGIRVQDKSEEILDSAYILLLLRPFRVSGAEYEYKLCMNLFVGCQLQYPSMFLMEFEITSIYDIGLTRIVDPNQMIRSNMISDVLDWVQDCRDNHKGCTLKDPSSSNDSGSSFTPTRLLHLLPAGNGGDILVQLVETSNMPKGARMPQKVSYATLSHCWGSKLPSRLTIDTYSELCQGKHLNDLPQTFRDAALVCQALGLHFLWIDALCILQDSSADWLYESSRMASIYTHGYVNLAATYARDDQGGLFDQSQDPLSANSPMVQLDWRGDCKVEGKFRIRSDKLWDRHVRDAPLNHRGWVFQETILSPRTINFASDQVRWRCRQSQGCETSPHSSDNQYLVNPPIHHFNRMQWLNLVSGYSELKLTRRSDILVALAGVAQVFGLRCTLGQNDYLAGLWRPELFRQLLWRRYGRKRDEPANGSIVPSWSWASIGGEVGWPWEIVGNVGGERLNAAASLRGVGNDCSDGNPFVQAQGMYLRLKCVLQVITLRNYQEAIRSYDELQFNHKRRLRNFLREHGFYRSWVEKNPISDAEMAELEATAPAWKYFDVWMDKAYEYCESNADFYFTPLLQPNRVAIRFYDDGKTGRIVLGLVLARTGGKGTYKRVGLLALYPERREVDDVAGLPEWHRGSTELAPEDSIEDHGDGCYEIKLI